MSLTLQPLDNPNELDLFLARPELRAYAKFYHTWQWGEFERSLGKRIERIGWYDGSKLVATALLVEEVGRFGKFIYCPRGPLTDYSDHEAATQVLTQLANYAHQPGITFLRTDPALLGQSPETQLFEPIGFKPAAKWFVQVGRAWIVDIAGKSDDQLMQWLAEHGMRSNVPRYLRKATRAGVTVRHSDKTEDLELFLSMFSDLDKRKGGIGTRPFDYYRKQFAAMAPSGLEKVFVAERDGRPLASALITIFAGEASYLNGASTDTERDLHAPQFMHIEIMKYARDHGCDKYNFWGVVGGPNFHPGHYGYGYSAFKKSFGGYAELYMPVADFIYKPLPYRLNWLKEKQHMVRHKVD